MTTTRGGGEERRGEEHGDLRKDRYKIQKDSPRKPSTRSFRESRFAARACQSRLPWSKSAAQLAHFSAAVSHLQGWPKGPCGCRSCGKPNSIKAWRRRHHSRSLHLSTRLQRRDSGSLATCPAQVSVFRQSEVPQGWIPKEVRLCLLSCESYDAMGPRAPATFAECLRSSLSWPS